jgi:hypothetical protein
LVNGGTYSLDDFTSQATAILCALIVGDVEDDVLEKDGDALNRLGTAGTLRGGELEGVGDCRGEGACGYSAVGGMVRVNIWRR